MAHPTDGLIGESTAIAELRERIRHLAAFDRPGSRHIPTVLIQGETGTGKGLVARLIHDSGGRASGPFVDVNCAAIPDTMLEAELFGFEAGAFTDARRAKPGLFEAAAGGTLFLDEVDALPPALQPKLLKAIEEKRVRRLGAVADRAVDVKLVAATQHDLAARVASRDFRADLFHRLAVLVLALPPLRVRGDDVLVLAAHLLGVYGRAHGVPPRRLLPDARAWLCAERWPGNVRELAHLLERATLLSPAVELDAAALASLRLPLGEPGPGPAAAPAAVPPAAPSDDDEAARIADAIRRAGGNVVRAAQLLGMGRNALRGRMRRYGIARPTLDELAQPHRTAPAAPSRATDAVVEPTWERKPVVVLAVALVLPADAPEPWTLGRRWQRALDDLVPGFGGTFVARGPSSATVAFGIPRTLEQLAPRALHAALALRQLAEDEEPALRPDLRFALHAGLAQVDVAAAEPEATLLPLGDTVALAERLVGHAGAGEILASAALLRRLESLCELRPRTVQMGADAVPCAAVVRRRPQASWAETRFVGRDRELAQIDDAFATAAGGAGQLVVLVGEPGIGKSRLVAELCARLASTPHRWLEGRCAAYATEAAFHVVVDALRRVFAIDDRDDAARARDKVRAGIAALGDGTAWTVPFVCGVLALDPGDVAVAAMDAATRRSETFRALKTLLLRLAADAPLVLVIEDLHWIDPASEECLAFVADAVPGARVLLVCTYRPGYRHPFPDTTWLVRISLRPLSDGDVHEITRALLGVADVPRALHALIGGKAEGNPFFAEELTRHLVEVGALRHGDGALEVASDLGDVAVPDTIHDLLGARIDRLADDARRAMQVASVIGREFALRLLARITETGDRVRQHVDELRSLELIYEKTAHPELAFMFKHALTHDVAYDSVRADRRRALHRSIALAIEELYADRLPELYETLAHHFDRADDRARALDYHERAADKAAETFANRAVVVHVRRALELVRELGPDAVPDDRRRGLEERLALASFLASDFAVAGQAWERAAQASTTPAAAGTNLAYASLGWYWAHRYDDSKRTATSAVDVGRAHAVAEAEALGIVMLGFDHMVRGGDVAAYQRRLDEALALAGAIRDEAVDAMLRFHVAELAEWTGDYRRSIALSEAVIADGRRLRLPHLVVWPAWFLGKAYGCLGQYARALAYLEEATEVCERIGDRVWKSRLLNTLGWAWSELGAPTQARLHNARAAELARAVGDPEILANAEINLAGNWLALGERGHVLEHLGPIQASLAADGDPWMRWRYALHAHHTAGRLALAEGRPDAALAAAEQERAGAERHRVPKVVARADVLRGEALLALERPDDAEQALAAAVASALRIEYPRAAWQALGLLADVQRRRGRAADADASAARRHALVEQVAATLGDGELRAAFRAAVT